MPEQLALDEATVNELIADPEPFRDAMDATADHTKFLAELRDSIGYALGDFGGGADQWRGADREDLAKSLAVCLGAHLQVSMERHNWAAFLGALELYKQWREGAPTREDTDPHEH